MIPEEKVETLSSLLFLLGPFEYPAHWPKRYNASNVPCDVLAGPCVCGAGHFFKEDWIIEGINKYGWNPKQD